MFHHLFHLATPCSSSPFKVVPPVPPYSAIIFILGPISGFRISAFSLFSTGLCTVSQRVLRNGRFLAQHPSQFLGLSPQCAPPIPLHSNTFNRKSPAAPRLQSEAGSIENGQIDQHTKTHWNTLNFFPRQTTLDFRVWGISRCHAAAVPISRPDIAALPIRIPQSAIPLPKRSTRVSPCFTICHTFQPLAIQECLGLYRFVPPSFSSHHHSTGRTCSSSSLIPPVLPTCRVEAQRRRKRVLSRGSSHFTVHFGALNPQPLNFLAPINSQLLPVPSSDAVALLPTPRHNARPR